MTQLKKALSGISATVADFSSLEVVTLTGDISTVFNTASSTDDNKVKVLDWSKAIKHAYDTNNNNVKVALASKYEIDGDTTLFVSDKDATEELISAHNKAVKCGQEIRNSIMSLFGSVINDAVKS